MSILKQQVNFSLYFSSFFSVITHNSSVTFYLMHFLLWKKVSHEGTNFDTFKCFDENFSNSSCHFPNHKWVSPQILHNSSESCNRTPLYFFRSNVIYFAQKEPIKVEILRISNAQIKILQIFVIFETAHVFLQILHHSSVSWDITPLYFF